MIPEFDAMHDYLVVGAGLFGAVFARQMTDRGARCLVIDRRDHIGGNCHTERVEGINVHRYGPHIFHTESRKVWDYMCRWTEFNRFRLRPKVTHGGKVYSFPINMMTMHQLWGVVTPAEAEARLAEARVPVRSPGNLEEWVVSQVGWELYEKFIRGYTKKQWNRDPKDLPASIVKRLPIRLTYDEDYFNDRYQGIPVGGYTGIFERMLEGIPVELGVDFLGDRGRLEGRARKVVYTGPIDEFFGYDMGHLEWRSLRFEREILDVQNHQGVAVMNYTEEQVPYTRICEHKHFEFGTGDRTVVTREYPQNWQRGAEPYYPINDERNNELYQRYRDRVDGARYVMGGRLADYKYYDMHHVVGSALARAEAEII